MTSEVWLAIVACIAAVIALLKFGFSEYIKASNKIIAKETASHQRTITNFSDKVRTIEQQYYDTVAQLNQLKIQLANTQKEFAENTKQLKIFVDITKAYVQDAEKRMKQIEQKLGSVILK